MFELHVRPVIKLSNRLFSDLRKIAALLSVFARSKKRLQYYALDLSYHTLQTGLATLPIYANIECTGICGTFSDALHFAASLPAERPRIFLSLGSIFGNGTFSDALRLMKPWAEVMRKDDRMLLGMDGTQDEDKVWQCYNDLQGRWHTYLRNGLSQSNRLLGETWYVEEEWDVVGECYRAPMIPEANMALRHRLIFRANTNVVCKPLSISWPKGTEIVNESYKYMPEDMAKQFDAAGLLEENQWQAPEEHVCKCKAPHYTIKSGSRICLMCYQICSC